jgi:hypothetical protein
LKAEWIGLSLRICRATCRRTGRRAGTAGSPDSETIGVFGVGSKRAVVALAETTIIKTRHRDSKSYQVDITKDWLETNDWDIPHFEFPDIDDGATIIDLSCLRKSFSDADVEFLREHIGETYEWFLQIENCVIKVNGAEVQPWDFERWSFPPGFEPRSANFAVDLKDQRKVSVEIFT